MAGSPPADPPAADPPPADPPPADPPPGGPPPGDPPAAPGEVVITGDLGPNPAPVVELVWALWRQRGWRTRSLHLVADAHARRWFHELEQGLGQFERVFGWRPDIAVHAPPCADERTPAEAVAWNETRWACAVEAIAAAGDDPVVFGLFAGRRRSMTAGVALLYPFLARAGDPLVDVRVTDRRVEGATGFYFPEQPDPTWNGVDPRSVDVVLAELPAPRLRDRLPAAARSGWRAAMAHAGTPVPGEAPPTLEFRFPDPRGPRVWLAGRPLPLSPALATWYLALALARLGGDGWVASDDLGAIRAALDHARARFGLPWWHPDTPLFEGIATGEWAVDRAGALKKLRADLVRRVREFCVEHGIAGRHLVEPAVRRGHHVAHQRLALEPRHIRVEGLAPVT